MSFMVRDGDRAALVGANGVGKSTLLSLIAGDIQPTSGTLTIEGQLGVMRQFVGVGASDHGDGHEVGPTARELLVSLAPAPVRAAAERLRTAEARAAIDPMRYADALAAWGDAGGYAAEVHWEECAMRAVGLTLDQVADRPLRMFSGGEQKRLALEILLRGDADVLLLDEPDNFLDVEAKRWLEGELVATRKTILYVSHDRELLAATATRVITVEAARREGGRRNCAWTHGGGFAGYAEARRGHLDKIDRDRTIYATSESASRTGGRDAAAGQDLRGLRAKAEGGREPSSSVRRARGTPGRRARATHQHAPRRGSYRQAGPRRRATRARRAHRSVRPRDRLRRPGRRARRQRCRQESLPAPAGRGRHR